MNWSQKEVTFATSGTPTNDGLVNFNSGENSASNGSGRDNFYSATTTPAYAHSYLLTDVLSTDYVDVTGDGPTDDDFGSYTKFNYTRKDSAYHWKAPYGNNIAQYDPGFKSDTKDNKASYLEGYREQWMLHSIETKNDVAEFYTSARSDGKGANSEGNSYKLDSIKLYNKHDRFINTANAVPIKTIIFSYDYSLCKGVLNNASGAGKLTLRKIYIRYGNSDKSMLSPYQFEYNSFNPDYAPINKDRWGAYKPNNPAFPNGDFPFVNQDDTNNDTYAGAWSLSQIHLPSGGTIKVDYEADDYAYVQDKMAMEMVMLSGVGNTKNYASSNQLYQDKNSPDLYFYFKRKKSREKAGISFRDNYLHGQQILYYNLDTRLVDNSYEPVKGYADIEDAGYCNNDPQSDYGYIKVKSVIPEGGGATLNPASYTAINFARYYLPHIIFPGQDPDAGTLSNILGGLKYAFSELVSIAQNPVVRMTKEGKAKDIDISKSFIRLTSTGLKKKGGGQRVKEITFYDNWNQLAGGNAQAATYGKKYDYTTDYNDGYGTVSSGVASYEPQIGGDENPFRMPANYQAQSGSHFPPNDPVGLYSELPVGESLYPAPVVGYSKVTVTSIHQAEGRSSQGMDIYDFYTARDFPIRTQNTALDVLEKSHQYSFLEQKTAYSATQGYTLIFNDMHGKPKRTEHRVIKPNDGTTTLISYTQYKYKQDGANKLDNNVSVLAYDPATQKIKKTQQQVGLEEDVTIDTRAKDEETNMDTYCANLNVTNFGPFVIPVPWFYPWSNSFSNKFNAVVATKVIQQYGILTEVENYSEGAVTTLRNEAFDPVTGQPLITSVNNEYGDKVYNVNYPAYWGYKGMGPSYVNTGYQEHFDTVNVTDGEAELPTGATVANYRLGDELLISYKYNGTTYTNNTWVMEFKNNVDSSYALPDCFGPADVPILPNIDDTIDINLNVSVGAYPHPIVAPRFKYSASWPSGNGSLQNVDIKVIRSGDKNQLNESIESYTGLASPFAADATLKNNLDSLITISAREYSDTLTARLPQYDSFHNPYWSDSLNIYVNGTREIYRLYKEYAYVKNRNYSTNTVRNAGLFSAASLWRNLNIPSSPSIYVDSMYWCRGVLDSTGSVTVDSTNTIIHTLFHVTGYIPVLTGYSPYTYLFPDPSADNDWIVSRTVTKYSPWGYELENKDAIGNYTSAIYGFNQSLPVALAQNAQQREIIDESFEDLKQLQVINNPVYLAPHILLPALPLVAAGNSAVYKVFGNPADPNAAHINSIIAHTGFSCLEAPGQCQLKTGGWGFYIDYGNAPPYPEYNGFMPVLGKKYLLSYWYRPRTITGNETTYSSSYSSNPIIDGWQKVESVFTPGMVLMYYLFPPNSYIDDIRIVPMDGNMKSFVYNPYNQKLMATLDENNYATFYEYDQEGNLVRTKKETEKGIMTLSESRSANPKR